MDPGASMSGMGKWHLDRSQDGAQLASGRCMHVLAGALAPVREDDLLCLVAACAVPASCSVRIASRTSHDSVSC